MRHARWVGILARLAIDLRSGFWFVPAVLTAGAVALALALVELGEHLDFDLGRMWPRMFGAGAEGSRAMLSAIASSMITVAGVVFSITIVALAQASTQYTSRVLRNFMRDRLNQWVLGVFVGVYTYCLVVLRTISSGQPGPLVPALAVFTGLVLAMVAIGFLIVFIHHIATAMEAGEIARSVMRDTREAIDRLYPDGAAASPAVSDVAACEWYPVPALETGYIQSVRFDELVGLAVRHDAVVRMAVAVGGFVAEGQTIAYLGRASAQAPDAEVVRGLNGLVAVNAFRTTDQDAAFGFRQLVDIALKALSPGINDTTTAVTCLDYLSALLQRLAPRHVEPRWCSRDGRVRVIATGPDFEDFVELALAQVLENAGGNTVVLLRLLQCIGEVATVSNSPARRSALAARVDAVAGLAAHTTRTAHARTTLEAAARRAHDACIAPLDAAVGPGRPMSGQGG